MDFFGSDKPVQQAPVVDPEVARLKAENRNRIVAEENAKKEEKFARSQRMRGSKSLMSGGYRGYEDDEDKLGTKA